MSPKKKAITRRRAVVSLIAIVALLLLIFGGGSHLGLFSGSELKLEEAPGTLVLGVPMTGSYYRAGRRVDSVLLPLLDARGIDIARDRRATIIYDYPWDVRKRERRSLAGLATDESPTDATKLDDKLRLEAIPARQVLVARTEAHPSVASFKLFPKIRRWLEDRGYVEDGPALELFHEDYVELQVPVRAISGAGTVKRAPAPAPDSDSSVQ